MITLQNVSFSYSQRPFIQNMNLTIQPGMVTGLIGPNGAGKSTVLGLAAGLLPAQKGVVLMNGKDIRAIRPTDRAKQAALLRQNAHVPRLQAWDVVMAARYPHRGLTGYSAADREIVRRSMEHTGCARYESKRMDQLSGGECQKVFMAAALAQQTDILLLDEPTVYLDISAALSWMKFVRTLNKTASGTVAAVLHDLRLALHFCDRLILFAGGAVAAQGTPDELVENGAIGDIFGVKIRVFQQDGQVFYVEQLE